jgi:endonuclease YncB( thermonuclease family)
MNALPFVLLIVALLLFLISTRQFPTIVRFGVWFVGAVSLVACAWLVINDDGVGRGGQLAQSALNDETGPIVRSALGANWQIVGEAFTPLLFGFVLLGVLIAIVALIAFSPGEQIERAARPVITFVIGVASGGALALVAVALGFSGYFKPRAYVFTGEQIRAIDGDTIRVEDVSLRLTGIDAPELDQTCLANTERTACGENAALQIESLVSSGTVICRRQGEDSDRPPDESFGRPLVACEVQRDGERFDLGEALIESGWAVRYVLPEEAPRMALVHGACTLHPSVWRRDAEARAAFIRATRPPQECNTLGL